MPQHSSDWSGSCSTNISAKTAAGQTTAVHTAAGQLTQQSAAGKQAQLKKNSGWSIER